MSPIFSEVSDEYGGKVRFVKVNSDRNEEVLEKYDIMGLPTLALFYKGKMVSMQAGAMRKDGLKDFIQRSLEKNNIPH